MKAYVGVTDDKWHKFLAERPEINEVNFWRPGGGRAFRALTSGEPFFFKSHSPHNRVVGGGFFSGFTALPVSAAWELFGESNGVASQVELRRSVARYRGAPLTADEDPTIGCVLIRDVVFFPAGEEADPPPEFASNIVQGKGYALADSPHMEYFHGLIARLLGGEVEIDLEAPWHRPGPVYGDPRLAPYRLGQQAFKAMVLGAYESRCAVTASPLRPTLEAAHIIPLPRGGEHRLDNGLLLRSDIHRLFDLGYLGVDTHYRLLVSPRIVAEFGEDHGLDKLAGQPISVPDRRADRPNQEFLERHLDETYRHA